MSGVQKLNLGTDAIPVAPLQGGSLQVIVDAGSTVQFSDQAAVQQAAQGTIAVGASQAFSMPVWLRSVGSSQVRVSYMDPSFSLFPLSAVPVVPGAGYFHQPNYGLGTSAALGNGNLRVQPVYIPAPCVLQALFCEYTVAGDAASVFVPCVYSDNGRGLPGALLTQGAGISTGGTPGVYSAAVSQAVLPGMYWIGGVVQGVTVTQPTMRIAQWGPYSLGTSSLPATGALAFALQLPGVTAALPAQFGASPATASTVARVGFQVA